MTDLTCERVRDLLPDRYHGELATPLQLALETHLQGCPSCSEEAELVDRVWKARPGAPEHLEEALLVRLRQEAGAVTGRRGGGWRALFGMGRPDEARGRFGAPSWALSAAALLLVAVGTRVVWEQWRGEGVASGGEDLLEAESVAPEAWLWDSGVVAGGPILEGLSEEDLETLLRELGG